MRQQRSWRPQTMCASFAARRWRPRQRNCPATTSSTRRACARGSSASRPAPPAASTFSALPPRHSHPRLHRHAPSPSGSSHPLRQVSYKINHFYVIIRKDKRLCYRRIVQELTSIKPWERFCILSIIWYHWISHHDSRVMSHDQRVYLGNRVMQKM